jgi:nucleoside-diphosphate-sugar epimerase
MEGSASTRVLVTGGTGFVGSHVVELLLEQGYAVTCLVRDTNHLSWLQGRNITVVRGDCTDADSLKEATRGVSTVIHLAGLTKAKHASEYYRVNHLGTRNVLTTCAETNPGIRKFVFISSLAAVGPSPDGRLLTESDEPRPVSDYGKSKLLAEQEALRYRDRFPVVILRPSAVYGPRDRDMFELFRWASQGMTLSMAGGERFINPCFVSDLAGAVLKAATTATPSGSIYFIAESRSYSWTEFRRTLLATGGVSAIDIKIPVSVAYGIGLISELIALFGPRAAVTSRQKIREASQRSWLCSTAEAETELGFSHAFSLEQGLRITWQWYRHNHWLE